MKKIPAILILSVCSAAFATALGDSVAKMSPGSWLTFQNNGQRGFGGGAGELLDACDGFHTILEWTGKAAWDPVSDEFVFIGQGHYACQKYIRYSAAQNQWRVEPSPSWTGGIGHAYFNNTVNPANGDHYYKKYGGKDVYKRSGSTGTWSTLPQNTLVQYWQCCTALEYFPELNGLVMITGTEFTAGKGNVYFFSETSKQWSTLASNIGLSDYSNQAVYNPARRVMVIGRGSIHKIDSAGKVTALKSPPVSLGDGDGQARLSVDPASGKYLALANDGLYEFEVLTDTWKKVSTATPPPSSGGYVTFDIIAAPVPAYGVTMWVKWNYGNSKVFLYKHAPSSTASEAAGPRAGTFLSLSPNPVKHRAVIHSGGAIPTLYGVSGGRLSADLRKTGGGQFELDVSAMPAGVYFVRIAGKEGRLTRRMLVSR